MAGKKSGRSQPRTRGRTNKPRPKASQVGAAVPLRKLPTEAERVASKHGTKKKRQKSAQERGAKAKSTRVANPKRSTTLQASKRANARGVDGRLAG
jgi:hypothetical protein